MRVGIVGSRKFPEPAAVIRRSIIRLMAETRDLTVVSGGAPGVDREAVEQAVSLGVKTEVIAADWVALGKRAGVIRNAQLVARVDHVVALWDGTSPGTKSTIDQALKQGKHLEVIFP